MTLDQLKALCAVVDCGGFRAASESLHKSQSAISIAIKNLEQELQICLFERDGYRPLLTTRGKVIAQKARAVLSQTRGISDLAHHYAQGIEPELRIVVSELIDMQMVLDALSTVRERFSGTRLTLLVENFNAPLELIEDNLADIAIGGDALRDRIDPTLFTKLPTVSLMPVVSNTSEYAQNAIKITTVDMDGSTQVVVSDRSRNRDEKNYGVLETTVPWRVNDFLTKKQIILSGLGWGRLPMHMICEELKTGRLVALSSSDFGPVEVETFMARTRSHPFGPVAEAFWELMVKKV
ncbi:LysR family transcriptional regulator [Kiloniella antarctica]|uniref:LysR family transcriptional regulator n=1 Tax=Kiloniella antarctica TaxID=1550907 RepID=A0ABW5BIA1_9PROT